MMEQIDTVVIGAGAVGLAIARRLSLDGHECLVLERETAIGQGVSSRNSEVIHAGIYYAEGSLKGRLCVSGKSMLYAFCEKFGVGFRRCGKIIAATSLDDLDELERIKKKASNNGVADLKDLDQGEIQALEPEICAVGGLLSPSTGIVSAHEYMLALQGEVEAHGGAVSAQSEVTQIVFEQGRYRISVSIGDQKEPFHFSANRIVNAAGLGATRVANSIVGLPQARIPNMFFCRGNYFSMSGKNPFNHLIYPVPPKSGAGLGIHATIDLGDQVKFGPDVEYIDSERYDVNSSRLQSYYSAIRQYFPGLKEGSLSPSYAGIRPKIQGPDELPKDFIIQEESTAGFPGLVNLFGIESPGLTASLAIADEVADFYRWSS